MGSNSMRNYPTSLPSDMPQSSQQSAILARVWRLLWSVMGYSSARPRTEQTQQSFSNLEDTVLDLTQLSSCSTVSLAGIGREPNPATILASKAKEHHSAESQRCKVDLSLRVLPNKWGQWRDEHSPQLSAVLPALSLRDCLLNVPFYGRECERNARVNAGGKFWRVSKGEER